MQCKVRVIVSVCVPSGWCNSDSRAGPRTPGQSSRISTRHQRRGFARAGRWRDDAPGSFRSLKCGARIWLCLFTKCSCLSPPPTTHSPFPQNAVFNSSLRPALALFHVHARRLCSSCPTPLSSSRRLGLATSRAVNVGRLDVNGVTGYYCSASYVLFSFRRQPLLSYLHVRLLFLSLCTICLVSRPSLTPSVPLYVLFFYSLILWTLYDTWLSCI